MNDSFKENEIRRQKGVSKAQDRTERSVKMSSTIRDSVLIVTQLMQTGDFTPDEVKEAITNWREWLWNEWDNVPQEPEKAPYSEDFLLDALTNKTYKSEAQKSFYEAMLRKWYGHTTAVDDEARAEGMIAREEERAARNENV